LNADLCIIEVHKNKIWRKNMQNPLKNLFYKVNINNVLNVEELKKVQSLNVIIIVLLGLSLVIPPFVLAYSPANVTIQNKGTILPLVKISIIYRSEIRGVFFEDINFGYPHNWTLIAKTLASYGINAVFLDVFSTFSRRDDSEIRRSIDAFHAYGIEYHAVMSVLHDTRPPGGSVSYGTEYMDYNGNIYGNGWSHCPIKAHDYVINAVKNFIGNFSDVDGIMLDYIRHADQAVGCYCPYCKAAFDEWYYENYGQHVSNWTEFYPDQPKWNIYANWRTIPVSELVRDIYSYVKSVNQKIVVSAATWTLFSNNPVHQRKWMGQDTAYWIKEGWLDMNCPMCYNINVTHVENYLDTDIKYWMGGAAEGSIPMVPILRYVWPINYYNMTAAEMVQQINAVKARGLDGWIIWHYSGPCNYIPNAPNITDVFELLGLPEPETFSIANIKVETTANSATITWATTKPATSRVEYGINPLFGAEWKIHPSTNFGYWNITRINPMIEENSTLTTFHSITLNGLLPATTYYFRVQSKGTSGVGTSKVLQFTTKS
jgi:hypothetical protein